jgi:hypothetical protein
MSSCRSRSFDKAVHTLAKAINFDDHPTGFPSEETIGDAIKLPHVKSALKDALYKGTWRSDVTVGYHHHKTLPFTLFISQGCEMGYRTNHNFGHPTWYLANLDQYPGIAGVWLVSRENGWTPEPHAEPRISLFVITRLMIFMSRYRESFWSPSGPGFQLAKSSFESHTYIGSTN